MALFTFLSASCIPEDAYGCEDDLIARLLQCNCFKSSLDFLNSQDSKAKANKDSVAVIHDVPVHAQRKQK